METGDAPASNAHRRSRAVPRYFFHTQTEIRLNDAEGLELDGPVEARREAIRTCGEMMRDAPESFWASRPWFVVVTDDAGIILWEIRVDGAVTATAAAA